MLQDTVETTPDPASPVQTSTSPPAGRKETRPRRAEQLRKLRVGVNLVPVVPDPEGELPRLVGSVLSRLRRERGLSLVYFVAEDNRDLCARLPARARVVVVRAGTDEIEARYRYGEFDVLFAPCADPGVRKAVCPMVVMLSDTRHYAMPEDFAAAELARRALCWEWPARAAQTVCVLNTHAAGQLQESLRIPERRLCVIHPGSRLPRRQLVGEAPGAGIIDDLPERFLVYPADTAPHRNHAVLLQALARARERAPDMQLVLVGCGHTMDRALQGLLRRLKLERNVRWLRSVNDQQAQQLYSRADGLVYPSGFDNAALPLVDAMASHCAIACADSDVLSALVGEAALRFSAEDPDDMALAMLRLWRDVDMRSALAEKGKQRLAEIESVHDVSQLAGALRDATESFDAPLAWRPRRLRKAARAPRVSIVIACFQQAGHLRDCIDHVLGQDYPQLEVIVVDGGSTDDTTRILASYGDRLHWSSERNEGVVQAFNLGLQQATGDVVGCITPDDRYRPGILRDVAVAFVGRSGCKVVYGDARYLDAQGAAAGRHATETFSLQGLLSNNGLCRPAVFFDRGLAVDAGMFDAGFSEAYAYDLWLRLARSTPFHYLPVTLVDTRGRFAKAMQSPRYIREAIQACVKRQGRLPGNWCRRYAAVMTRRWSARGGSSRLGDLVRVGIFAYAVIRYAWKPLLAGAGGLVRQPRG